MGLLELEPIGIRETMPAFWDLANRFLTPTPGWGELGAAPSVEVTRHDTDMVVKLDFPGADPQSFNVAVEGKTLTISAERTEEKTEGERIYTSRSYGALRQSWRLPSEVAEDQISAEYTDGVLTVTLTGVYSTPSKPKRIEVKMGQHSGENRTIEAGANRDTT